MDEWGIGYPIMAFANGGISVQYESSTDLHGYFVFSYSVLSVSLW